MFNYTAYQLGINSALPLPELKVSAGAATDVIIRAGKLQLAIPKEVSPEGFFSLTSDCAYLHWDALGTFLVRDGKEIVIDSNPGVDEKLIRLPLLGIVLGVLLHQRGRLVLHASAVAINDEAVVFIGNRRRGKSTMAATLYARGHDLMADDVVALEFSNEGRVLVLPGYPQLKLCPEAVNPALGDDPDDLPELADGFEKRCRKVSDRFSQRPLPLKCVYVLSRGSEPDLKLLDPQAAIVEIIRNTYVARFGKQLLQGANASAHLRQCTRLISQVPVCRLERPDAVSLLPKVAQLVEEHCNDI